jgi:hypothetical protein
LWPKTVPEGAFPWDEADRVFTLLVKRAAELSDCKPSSSEEEEFDRLESVIDAYEAKRWPNSGWRVRSGDQPGATT